MEERETEVERLEDGERGGKRERAFGSELVSKTLFVRLHLHVCLMFQMESEFGVDHVYNADTFNEMTPKSK